MPNHRPFAASITPVNFPVHTDIVLLSEAKLLVATTTIGAGPPGSSTEQPQLTILVWFYSSAEEEEGWKALLYEGLSDFLQHRYSLSVFKLATSIELFADQVFERYLRESGKLSGSVVARIMGEYRSSWRLKFERIKDLGSFLLAADEYAVLSQANKAFMKYVREPRNEFAHGKSQSHKHEDAERAYEAAFDVLWPLDRLSALIK